LQLSEGKNIIRLLSRTDGFNLNWIIFSGLTSTIDIKDVGFNIHPNPASDFFEISFCSEGSRIIQFIDLRGGLLKQYHSVQNNERINVSGLNPGMYLIKVKDAMQTYIQKLRIV